MIFDPTDPDTLIDYEDSEDQFRVVKTTRNLLKFSLHFELVLQSDGTYKLMWQGFPVLILGSSDYDRRFHPILSFENGHGQEMKPILILLNGQIHHLYH